MSSTTTSKQFANFRVAQAGTGSLDPGLSDTVAGRFVLWNVYLPLLGYEHANGPDGATIVPYLAQALPQVSADGRTYTLTLRKGLEYSDGSPVKASDFEATIERDYELGSPGVAFFGNIVGADRFGETRHGDISGITANDRTGKITIRLFRPQADFENVLATTFTALVPAGSPAKDQSTSPLPSTGPYTIESYRPNRQASIVRNPKFDASTFDGNVPAGNPDRVTLDVVRDPAVALQRVIGGQDDYDPQPIPTDRLLQVQKKYGDQIEVYTPGNTYYFFMNTRVPPFDKVQVRQAVNDAIDRQELVRLIGGLAHPTENILPPTYPQFEKHELYPHNLARAKRLIRQACPGGCAPVTVWSHGGGIAAKTTAYLTGVLNRIGLTATERIVGSGVYRSTVGDRATKAQIGFADRYQDHPHPLDWFDVFLNGRRITQTHEDNYANFDDPSVDERIDALEKEPTRTDAVDARWAALDEAIMQQAPWAPFLNRQATDFFNADIDLGCYVNHVLYGFDYATICHR